jgi:hypothetical protein
MGVRLYPHQEARIDQWIAQQDEEGLGRHEAIRRLIDIGLDATFKTKKPRR